VNKVLIIKHLYPVPDGRAARCRPLPAPRAGKGGGRVNQIRVRIQGIGQTWDGRNAVSGRFREERQGKSDE
jgi:hypothetical protein